MSLDIHLEAMRPTEVYWANITHNLNNMAEAAGIYKELWRPEEIGITHAGQLIKPLEEALIRLNTFPETMKTYNPENGWGHYENLVKFVSDYLSACRENPNAKIKVSR